jgi:hypothetical protein
MENAQLYLQTSLSNGWDGNGFLVSKTIVDILSTKSFISQAYDIKLLSMSLLPEVIKTRAMNSYFSSRSGDIQIVPKPGYFDGGKTFNVMRGSDKESESMHGDNHALWIDPTNSDYIMNGNDGGVILSYNGGTKWKNFFRKIPTTQFYNITYDMKQPYNILGSVQDEGSYMGSIQNEFGKKPEGIMPWQDAPGGEGTIIAVDPNNSDLVYASSFYGRLMKSDLKMPRVPWGQKPNPDSVSEARGFLEILNRR